MYKNYFLLIFFCCFSFAVVAQSLSRQCIGSAGVTVQSNGVLLQQTVGQPYATGSVYDDNFRYNPGFQQPVISVKLIKSSLNVLVYPNPTVEQFSIEADKTLKNARIQITDATGKLILKAAQNELKTYSVNCSDWPNGAYLLTLTDSDNNYYTSKIIVGR